MDEIRYERSGGVGTITLSRPERRNALTDEMLDEIAALVRGADEDDDVRCVVLRGDGPSFCSGFDVGNPDDFYGGAETKGARFAVRKLRHRAEVMRDILYSLTPVVAQVHGHCIGAGLYLVLVSDFAVASEETAFGLPEERFGSAGTSWLYPFVASQCGLKRANELLMTGRRFEAVDAERWGLVNRVVPADGLDSCVADLATSLSELPRDGVAVGRTVAHMTYELLGIGGSFVPHYASHPLIVRMQREADEFDFHATSRQEGLRAAMEERDRRFGGAWWGW